MLASILPAVLISKLLGGKYAKVQKKVQDNKAHISNISEESFTNIRTVKAFATEEVEVNKYRKGNILVYNGGFTKAMYYGVFNFVGQFFVFGSMAVILILGQKLYREDKITLGAITSFMLQMM